MRHSTFASLLITVSLLACASASSAPPVTGSSASITETETGGVIRLSQESRSVSIAIEASAARVWSVLPAVYEKLGIATEVKDAANRTIGTSGFTQQRLDGRRTADQVVTGYDFLELCIDKESGGSEPSRHSSGSQDHSHDEEALDVADHRDHRSAIA